MTNAYVPGRMTTLLNRKIFPLQLTPEDLKDIWPEVAHSMSQTNRWNGHTLRPISVAQHEVIGGEIVRKRVLARGGSIEEARIAEACFLVHDFLEGLGFQDVIAPLKDLLPTYVEEEAKGLRVVCDVLGLPYEMPPEAQAVDMDIRNAESRDQRPACDPIGPVAEDIPRIPSWSARDAERRWLEAFNRLFGTSYQVIDVPIFDVDYAGDSSRGEDRA